MALPKALFEALSVILSMIKGSNRSSLAVGLCLLSMVRHLDINLLKEFDHFSGYVSCYGGAIGIKSIALM